MSECSDYRNKYFSVLGDSISTFEGYSEPENAAFYDSARKVASGVLTPSDTWWVQVIEHFGGNFLVNNSFSGSTVCWHPLYKIQSYGCSDERTSSLHRGGVFPDVIMIYMGTNDWGNGLRVFRDDRFDCSEDNPSLFLSAYKQMIMKLKANYPQAEIWCFTLAKSQCSSKSNFSFPYYFGGRHISEYCDAIRTCAKELGCRVIDLFNRAEPYDTLDGFHPNLSGMKTIAGAVIDSLR